MSYRKWWVIPLHPALKTLSKHPALPKATSHNNPTNMSKSANDAPAPEGPLALAVVDWLREVAADSAGGAERAEGLESG